MLSLFTTMSVYTQLGGKTGKGCLLIPQWLLLRNKLFTLGSWLGLFKQTMT